MMTPIRLVDVVQTQGVCRTPDGDECAVYGVIATWSDGSRSRVEDLGTSSLAVARFASLLAGSDLEKIHFRDVIEDFLT